MPRIIVGLDGSSHSIRTLKWALKEGALQQAAVTVLTVHSVPASPWTGNPTILEGESQDLEKIRQLADEMTQKVMSQLGESQPASVTVYAVAGFPAEELINASRDADLVVVGSRGGGGFARLLQGSVSSQVAEHAHCPVVVVPSEE